MARLRFPGRPGQRYGRSLIRFMPHEAQKSQILFFNLTANIQRNLKWFYDTFGDSDEEEDFDGFTLDDEELEAYHQLQKERQSQENGRRMAKRSKLLPPQRVHSSGRTIRNVVRRSYVAMLRGEEDLSPKLYTLKRPEELVGYGVKPKGKLADAESSPYSGSSSPSKITSIKIKLLPDGKKAKIVRRRRPPAMLGLDFVRPDLGGPKAKPLTQQEKRVKMMREKLLRDNQARERVRKRKEREKLRKQEKAQREKLKRERAKEKRQQKKMREKAKKEKIRERQKAKTLAKKEKLLARKSGILPPQRKSALLFQDLPIGKISVPANKLSNKRTDLAVRQILARAKGQQRKPVAEANPTMVGKRMIKKSLMLNDMVADVNFLQRTGSPSLPSRTAAALTKIKTAGRTLSVKSRLQKTRKVIRMLAASPVSPQISDRDSDSVLSSPPSATKIAGSFYLPSFSARSSRIIKPCKRYLENDESPSLKSPNLLTKPVSASLPREDSSTDEGQDGNNLLLDESSDDTSSNDLDYRPNNASTLRRITGFQGRKKLTVAPRRTAKHKLEEKKQPTRRNKLIQRYQRAVLAQKPLEDIERQNENAPKLTISKVVETVRLKKIPKRSSSTLYKRKVPEFQKVAAFSPIRKKSESETERKPQLASPVLHEVKGSHRAHLHKLAKDKRSSPLSSEVKTPQHSRPTMGGGKGTHLDALSKQMVEAMEADMSPEQTAIKPSKMPKVDAQPAAPLVLRGPRIKHVCRRASVALGLEVATFPDSSVSAESTLSALPLEERDNVKEPVKIESATDGRDEPTGPPSKYNRKNRGANYKKIRQALLEGAEITEDDGEQPLMADGELPFLHNKKCRVAPYAGVKVAWVKRQRCGQCGPCQTKKDCGVCDFCLDKVKFGGPNKKRQACIHRKCWNPQYKNAVLAEVKEGKRDKVPVPLHMANYRQGQVGAPEGGYRPQVKTALSPFKQRSSRLGKPKARIKLPTRRGVIKVFANRPMSRAQRIQMEKEKAKLRKLEANRNSTSRLTVAKLKAKPQIEPLKISHHRINIDFKEDYDVETAWQRGIAILSSEPMVPRTVCYLCSSTGNHELIYCNICCEPFHLFCLEDYERPLDAEKENWCCRHCKFCHVCGRQDKLLTCDKCHSSYHPECLGPNYPTKPSSRRKIWVCTKCVKCKSCGATTPGQMPNAQWSHDFSLCQDCGKLFDRGNYCPICSQCYEDDDYVSKMMQCAQCDRWVHAKCEGLTDDMYHIMTDIPETVPYHCTKCDPVRPAKWQVELEEEMEAGFQNVLRAMYHCRSAAHLVNAEKKVKHSKSGNRSASPASSSGTTRDLTASPALSDTTSVDSHSSHGESRTDLLSRRISPRFLKDPKFHVGNLSARAKERTEAKPLRISPVTMETCRHKNKDGEGQDCGEKSDKEDLTVAVDEVAMETSSDNREGVVVKGDVAVETQSEEANLASEAAAGIMLADEISVAEAEVEVSSRELCESSASSDFSQTTSSILQTDRNASVNKPHAEGILLGNRTKENEPTLNLHSAVPSKTEHLEARTVVPSQTSQDMPVECQPVEGQPLEGSVSELCVQDQQDGDNEVMPKITCSHPASDTTLYSKQVKTFPFGQPSNKSADVSVKTPDVQSKVDTHSTEEIPESNISSLEQMQQNKKRSESSDDVTHVSIEEFADAENATTGPGPQNMDNPALSNSANHCEGEVAVDQSDVLATGGVKAEYSSGTSGNQTPENSPRIKSEVTPGDNVSPKEGIPNLEDSITSELVPFRCLTEKPLTKADHPKDLKAVSRRVKNNHYNTVVEFCDDCVRIIQHSLSSETDTSLNLKRNNRTACSIFLKNMTTMFPWYKVETSRSWEQNQKFPVGMLSQAVLPPHRDHEYAQWKHTNHPLPKMLQPSALKRLAFSPTNRTPARIIGGNAQVTPLAEPNTDDTRRCCLCGRFSDEDPNDGGRLLYCGQDEWIHINCGLWSAEVFEEMDGSLINVHAAIWRGRQLRCEGCSKFGATVGCCQRGCPANFHFMCARVKSCVFQEDKKVFCNAHCDKVDRDTIQEGNFAVLRRVCVSLDNMKLNRNFTQGLEVGRINVIVGSLTVDDLGRLGPASDQRGALYPLEFRCQRVYWSTFDARRRCVYTIRISEYKAVATPKSPLDVNHTTTHSPGILNRQGLGKSRAQITELGSDMPSIPEMDEEGLQLGMERPEVETLDGVFELSLDSTGLESLLDPEMLRQCEAELRDGGMDPEAVLSAALEQVDAEIAMEMGDDLPNQMQTEDLEASAACLQFPEESSDTLCKSSPMFEPGELFENIKTFADDIGLTQAFPPPSTTVALNSTGLSETTLKSLPQSALTNHSSMISDALDGGSYLSDDLSRMVMGLNYAAQCGKIEEARRRSSQDSVSSARSVSEITTSEMQTSLPTGEVLNKQVNEVLQTSLNAARTVSLESQCLGLIDVNADISSGNAVDAASIERVSPLDCTHTDAGLSVKSLCLISHSSTPIEAPLLKCPSSGAGSPLIAAGQVSDLNKLQGASTSHWPANPSISCIPMSIPATKPDNQVQEASMVDTPTRSIFKFIDKLLTETGSQSDSKIDLPSLIIPQQTKDSLNIDTNIALLGGCKAQSTIKEIHPSCFGGAAEIVKVKNGNIVCPRGPENPESLVYHMNDASSTDIKNDDDLLRGFSVSSGIESDTGCLSSQESTIASKSAQDTCSDEDTDLSQRTRDIVTDVIELENLCEYSALNSTERKPLFSVAEIPLSQLSQNNMNSCTGTHPGQSSNLEVSSSLTVTGPSVDCHQVPKWTLSETAKDQNVPPDDKAMSGKHDATTSEELSRENHEGVSTEHHMDGHGKVDETFDEENRNNVNTNPVSAATKVPDIVVEAKLTDDTNIVAESPSVFYATVTSEDVAMFSGKKGEPEKSYEERMASNKSNLKSNQGEKKDTDVDRVSEVTTLIEQSLTNIAEQVASADQTGNKYSLDVESIDVDVDMTTYIQAGGKEECSETPTELRVSEHSVIEGGKDSPEHHLDGLDEEVNKGFDEENRRNVNTNAVSATAEVQDVVVESKLTDDTNIVSESPSVSNATVTSEDATTFLGKTGAPEKSSEERMPSTESNVILTSYQDGKKETEVDDVYPVTTANEQPSTIIIEQVASADQTGNKYSLDVESMEVDMPTCVPAGGKEKSPKAPLDLRVPEHSLVEGGEVSPETHSFDSVEGVQEMPTVKETVLIHRDIQNKCSDHKRQLNEGDESVDEPGSVVEIQEAYLHEAIEPAAKRRKIINSVSDEAFGHFESSQSVTEGPGEHWEGTILPSKLPLLGGTDKHIEDTDGCTLPKSNLTTAPAVESSKSVSPCRPEITCTRDSEENLAAATSKESEVGAQMEFNEPLQTKERSEYSDEVMLNSNKLKATLNPESSKGTTLLEDAALQKTASEIHLDFTLNDANDDVFLKTSDEKKQDTDKQFSNLVNSIQTDISQTLPKAVVILHDICKVQNNRVRSMSCNLAFESSQHMECCVPTSLKPDQGPFSSTPNHAKSKSLPNTPSLVRSLSKELPFLTESRTGRGIAEAEFISSDFKTEEDNVNKVSKTCQEECCSSSDEEPLAKLAKKISDSIVQDSEHLMKAKEESKSINELSGDLILDEKTGFFVISPNLTSGSEKSDLSTNESPGERKKYPMRSTFSRLTRITENPEDRVPRRKRSSSSSSSSKEKDHNPQEDDKSDTELAETPQQHVKRGRGRPRKLQPPIELNREGEKDFERSQPCDTPKQPERRNMDASQEVNQNDSSSPYGLQLKSVHKRLHISMQDKGSEEKDDANDETTRSLRKRTPGVLYCDTYRMRVAATQPQKSAKDVIETVLTEKVGQKAEEKLQKNLPEEIKPAMPEQHEQTTESIKSVGTKASSNDQITVGKEKDVSVDSVKPSEESKVATSEPFKPSRRWPLKRVTGDIVSNEALLDLWTRLQPDLGPLKQKPATPKKVEKAKISSGQAESTLQKNPRTTVPKDTAKIEIVPDLVAKSVASTLPAVVTTGSGVAVPVTSGKIDYLKCLFKSNACTQQQRLKMTTNLPNLTNKPGISQSLITSRQVFTLKAGDILHMKQQRPGSSGRGCSWGRGRGYGQGRGRGMGRGIERQEAQHRADATISQTTNQDPSCLSADTNYRLGENSVIPSTTQTSFFAPKSCTTVDTTAKQKGHSEGTAASIFSKPGQTSLDSIASLKNEPRTVCPTSFSVKNGSRDMSQAIPGTLATIKTPRVTKSVAGILQGAPTAQSLVRPFGASSAKTLAPKLTVVTMVPVSGTQSIPIYSSFTQLTATLPETSGFLRTPVSSQPDVSLVTTTKIIDAPSELLYAVPVVNTIASKTNMSSVHPGLNQSITQRITQPASVAIMPCLSSIVRNPTPTCNTIVPRPTRSPLAQVMSTHASSPFMCERALFTPVSTLAGSRMPSTSPSPVPVVSAQSSMSLSTPESAVDQLWSIIHQQAQQAQRMGIIPVEPPPDTRLIHSYASTSLPPSNPRVTTKPPVATKSPVTTKPPKRSAPDDAVKRVGAKRRKNPLEERVWFDEFGQLCSGPDLAKNSPPKQAQPREMVPKPSRPRPRVKNASGPRIKMPTYTEDKQEDKLGERTSNKPGDAKTELRRPESEQGHTSQRPTKVPGRNPPKTPVRKEDPRSLQALIENKENLSDRGSPPSPAQVQANEGFKLIFEVKSDDGFETRAETMEEAWRQVVEKVQERRNDTRMKSLSFAGVDPLKMLGIKHDALVFLIEQLFGAKNCKRYRFKFHQRHAGATADEEPPLNPHGCARAEPFKSRSHRDIFDFLASRHRKRPELEEDTQEQDVQHKSSKRPTSLDLPMAMRFRHLKETAKEAVGVYRSHIHGRGLFCKRLIEASEMVIEYSGTVIRSMLTDKREKYYESKGIGCYMFRIDDFDVVDATVHGNAARFINHSCDPNCYSRVIQVDNKKHIVIFASRKIHKGEELTYDYKFPIEDVKLPCNCGAMRCRKYLN